jgi:soluble lytic murein transglycosylase-like protein
VPTDLMFAIAQQESGWQSTIMACDGGIGTMQLMPATVTQVNNRFGTAYDVNTLDGNTKLGAQYIEWLIMYFGIFHFQKHFDLTTVEKAGPNGEELSLEKVVVAAYNVGPTALEQPDGSLKLGPVATTYANNVLALKAAHNWPA